MSEQKENKPFNKKILIITLAAVVVIAVAAVFGINMYKKSQAYNSAMAEIEAGDVTQGYQDLKDMGSYSKATDEIALIESNYADAQAAFEAKDYETAFEKYMPLGDYQDSRENAGTAANELVLAKSYDLVDSITASYSDEVVEKLLARMCENEQYAGVVHILGTRETMDAYNDEIFSLVEFIGYDTVDVMNGDYTDGIEALGDYASSLATWIKKQMILHPEGFDISMDSSDTNLQKVETAGKNMKAHGTELYYIFKATDDLEHISPELATYYDAYAKAINYSANYFSDTSGVFSDMLYALSGNTTNYKTFLTESNKKFSDLESLAEEMTNRWTTEDEAETEEADD